MTTTSIPRRVGNVRFGPVSQVNVQASPVNAEAKDDPADLMRSCQAVANAYGLPVVFSCETRNGTSRHTFYPDEETRHP